MQSVNTWTYYFRDARPVFFPLHYKRASKRRPSTSTRPVWTSKQKTGRAKPTSKCVRYRRYAFDGSAGCGHTDWLSVGHRYLHADAACRVLDVSRCVVPTYSRATHAASCYTL